ncbi:S1C family serine protease [Flocculibacter collagenilyticus]|uniref:S1C family serine protease n=1 Tax=Flocculibacter collagenilyticus TaxID=2744479 RepID=UPI001F25EE72|nr:serine protease [Flocculibacter collagenilyticus]
MNSAKSNAIILPAALVLSLLLMQLWFVPSSTAKEANQLFDDYAQSLVQIRLIEKQSGGKSSIGTGFIISDKGDIATNYHVVSGYVQSPEKYRLEYQTKSGDRGELSILNVDVINDLAIVQSSELTAKPFVLSQQAPRQGHEVFALGNPHDLGMIVVPGTYNGLKKNSFYQRIHFTGSINPGMSGGPAVNQQGEVIGINVATAGNQIGFLVPVVQLSRLIAQTELEPVSEVAALKTVIRSQLISNQKRMLDEIINGQWQQVSLGPATVAGEVAPFVKCWANSNSDKKDKQVESTFSNCALSERIFISDTLETGMFEMEYEWLNAEKFSSFRFYNFYEKRIAYAAPANKASKDDVTNFQCTHDLVQANKDTQIKSVFCARAYKDYAGLFDIVYIAASIDKEQQGLISHFTLSGVEQSLAQAFTKKFMEAAVWR